MTADPATEQAPTQLLDQATWTPQAPTSRPARSIAALLLLILVFAIGVAVGSSGALGRSASTGSSSPPPAGQPSAAPGASQPPGAPSDFGLFWEALGVIQQNFVGRADIDPQTLTYGAIRGMVEALGDTGHTVFLTPEEAQAEQNALDQNVVGIGVLLGEKDGQSVIVSVVPGSPAEAAGLKAGDVITAVDGRSTVGVPPDQLVDEVRGDAGSQVTLTVQRPSTGETLDFTITRAQIKFPSTSWTMVPGTDIALIRLSQFSAESANELLAARDAALAAGAQSIILDLRGNPGGYVDQAVRATSQFLHDKVVYISEDADGTQTQVKTDDSIASTDVPMVVLIDNNTASSAEIMSGAIQAAGRAQLVGQTTFGTGTVLLPFTLSDGSVIRLAVQRWLTPTGELIFGKGITPDVEVALGPNDVPIEPNDLKDMSPDQLSSITDVQLLKAIELLGGPTVSPDASPTATLIP
ncbi:MAG TPA: S41 family peptidase [Candidatus Limnocylindrales bacterium]